MMKLHSIDVAFDFLIPYFLFFISNPLFYTATGAFIGG